MKTLKIMTVGMMLFFASNLINAQVSVNVNIGTRPSWGPVEATADYYYIPDVQCYYDVRATQFIYLNNGVWIRSGNLPSQHRHYDLNRGYKVVLNDYHGSRPYANYRHDRVKYYKGYNGHPRQAVVYNDHDHDNHGKHKHNGNGNKGNKGKGHKHGH
ncbi:MAG: hypothetical protein V4572_12935 [Bacteroidota bacterium]